MEVDTDSPDCKHPGCSKALALSKSFVVSATCCFILNAPWPSLYLHSTFVLWASDSLGAFRHCWSMLVVRDLLVAAAGRLAKNEKNRTR